MCVYVCAIPWNPIHVMCAIMIMCPKLSAIPLNPIHVMCVIMCVPNYNALTTSTIPILHVLPLSPEQQYTNAKQTGRLTKIRRIKHVFNYISDLYTFI
jgi:hypothetical protein